LFLLCVCVASAGETEFQLIIHTVLLPKLIENTDKMNYCVSVQSNQRNTQVRFLPAVGSVCSDCSGLACLLSGMPELQTTK